MSRKEFPTRVKVAVIKRATDPQGRTYCEKCKALAKRWQIDHIDPDGMTGKPVIENAMLICEPCYQIKNPIDTSNIAKAKRREAIALHAKQPKGTIKSPGFPKKAKPEKLPMPGRISLFQDVPHDR